MTIAKGVPRNNNHPLSVRMQAYLERLQQARLALFEEANKKRPAPGDLVKSTDAVKKPRIDADGQSSIVAPGPVSIAQILTLTNDPGAQNFDVTIIPHDTVVKLLIPLLGSVDATRLEAAVNVSLYPF
jgi:symplekin